MLLSVACLPQLSVGEFINIIRNLYSSIIHGCSLRYLWRVLPLPDQTPTIFVSSHSSFHAVFSDTYIAVDMWKKSTIGNNRFNHMLVVVYHSLVPSLSFLSCTCGAPVGEAGHETTVHYVDLVGATPSTNTLIVLQSQTPAQGPGSGFA